MLRSPEPFQVAGINKVGTELRLSEGPFHGIIVDLFNFSPDFFTVNDLEQGSPVCQTVIIVLMKHIIPEGYVISREGFAVRPSHSLAQAHCPFGHIFVGFDGLEHVVEGSTGGIEVDRAFQRRGAAEFPVADFCDRFGERSAIGTDVQHITVFQVCNDKDILSLGKTFFHRRQFTGRDLFSQHRCLFEFSTFCMYSSDTECQKSSQNDY